MNSIPKYQEWELKQLIAEGDENAFFALFSEYAPVLRAFAFRFIHSDTAAEDIVQETFLCIWLHRDQLAAVDHLKAWIYKITSRLCLTHLRKQFNNEKKKQASGKVVSLIHTPADVLQLQEIQKAVQQIIAQMPQMRRNIYRLSREEGLKPAEIAAQCNMPVGTIKNNLSAAVKEIREKLIAAGYHITALVALLIKLF